MGYRWDSLSFARYALFLSHGAVVCGVGPRASTARAAEVWPVTHFAEVPKPVALITSGRGWGLLLNPAEKETHLNPSNHREYTPGYRCYRFGVA